MEKIFGSSRVNEWLKQIPRPVFVFLVKALVIFVLWKAIYIFWLRPLQVPDRFLVENITAQTCQILNLFTPGKPYSYTSAITTSPVADYPVNAWVGNVFHGRSKVLAIHPLCDGLEMMVLYVGFIFCFPSGVKRKLWFSVLGLGLIYIINVFRCIGLVMIVHDTDLRKWFDFAHHYLFVIIVYGFIFLLWMWFVNGVGRVAAGQVKQSRKNEIT